MDLFSSITGAASHAPAHPLATNGSAAADDFGEFAAPCDEGDDEFGGFEESPAKAYHTPIAAAAAAADEFGDFETPATAPPPPPPLPYTSRTPAAPLMSLVDAFAVLDDESPPLGLAPNDAHLAADATAVADADAEFGVFDGGAREADFEPFEAAACEVAAAPDAAEVAELFSSDTAGADEFDDFIAPPPPPPSLPPLSEAVSRSSGGASAAGAAPLSARAVKATSDGGGAAATSDVFGEFVEEEDGNDTGFDDFVGASASVVGSGEVAQPHDALNHQHGGAVQVAAVTPASHGLAILSPELLLVARVEGATDTGDDDGASLGDFEDGAAAAVATASSATAADTSDDDGGSFGDFEDGAAAAVATVPSSTAPHTVATEPGIAGEVVGDDDDDDEFAEFEAPTERAPTAAPASFEQPLVQPSVSPAPAASNTTPPITTPPPALAPPRADSDADAFNAFDDFEQLENALMPPPLMGGGASSTGGVGESDLGGSGSPIDDVSVVRHTFAADSAIDAGVIEPVDPFGAPAPPLGGGDASLLHCHTPPSLPSPDPPLHRHHDASDGAVAGDDFDDLEFPAAAAAMSESPDLRVAASAPISASRPAFDDFEPAFESVQTGAGAAAGADTDDGGLATATATAAVGHSSHGTASFGVSLFDAHVMTARAGSSEADDDGFGFSAAAHSSGSPSPHPFDGSSSGDAGGPSASLGAVSVAIAAVDETETAAVSPAASPPPLPIDPIVRALSHLARVLKKPATTTAVAVAAASPARAVPTAQSAAGSSVVQRQQRLPTRWPAERDAARLFLSVFSDCSGRGASLPAAAQRVQAGALRSLAAARAPGGATIVVALPAVVVQSMPPATAEASYGDGGAAAHESDGGGAGNTGGACGVCATSLDAVLRTAVVQPSAHPPTLLSACGDLPTVLALPPWLTQWRTLGTRGGKVGGGDGVGDGHDAEVVNVAPQWCRGDATTIAASLLPRPVAMPRRRSPSRQSGATTAAAASSSPPLPHERGGAPTTSTLVDSRPSGSGGGGGGGGRSTASPPPPAPSPPPRMSRSASGRGGSAGSGPDSPTYSTAAAAAAAASALAANKRGSGGGIGLGATARGFASSFMGAFASSTSASATGAVAAATAASAPSAPLPPPVSSARKKQ